MKLQRQINREIIVLDAENPIGSGGEGSIYSVLQDPSFVAKIYHNPTDDDADKLAVMLSMPPETSVAFPGHSSIAWPVDLLQTIKGKQKIVGYLMPKVSNSSAVHIFYTPKNRRQQKPLFNYLYLHRTARNLVAAINLLHNSDIVIGDVNESNILVSDTALVTLVDTDSFQVRDNYTDYTFRCPVGKAEFTPPELQGQSFRDLLRLPEHDLFGVAVLIFQLLMEGTHPFAGVYQGRGEPPTIEARIREGHFPYSRKRVPYSPMPLAPDFKTLHPSLRELFLTCFERGHEEPTARPDTLTWLQALKIAEDELVTCAKNPQHRYGEHLNSCPWCDRAKKLRGRDPFPSREAVENKQHLQPARSPKRKKLLPLSSVRPAAAKPPRPPKPITITQKLGQYQPLLLPIVQRSSSPPSMTIPTTGARGMAGVILDSLWGAIWGGFFAASVLGVAFGTYRGGGAIIGAILMGLLWGAFFGKVSEYIIPGSSTKGNPVLAGALGGVFIAAAIGGIVFGVSRKLPALGQGLLFGAILGTIWGGLWSWFKPPFALASARVRGRRGSFLGAIWGSFFGIIAAAILAVLFAVNSSINAENNSIAEIGLIFVSNIIPAFGLGSICGIVSGVVFGTIIGAPTLPLPMQLLGKKGAILGGIWGCFLGAIAGAILGSALPTFWPTLFISLIRVNADYWQVISIIFVAGNGALFGFLSGAVWGGMGKW
ncbi:MAG: DNA-binding protein [Cyanobacteriota bacterium]|nr:DNA-binding protein [Cyanobacteriota bacterium]